MQPFERLLSFNFYKRYNFVIAAPPSKVRPCVVDHGPLNLHLFCAVPIDSIPPVTFTLGDASETCGGNLALTVYEYA